MQYWKLIKEDALGIYFKQFYMGELRLLSYWLLVLPSEAFEPKPIFGYDDIDIYYMYKFLLLLKSLYEYFDWFDRVRDKSGDYGWEFEVR